MRIAGAPEIASYLRNVYSPSGERAFDYAFMGDKVYRQVFRLEAAEAEDLPTEGDAGLSMGRLLLPRRCV